MFQTQKQTTLSGERAQNNLDDSSREEEKKALHQNSGGTYDNVSTSSIVISKLVIANRLNTSEDNGNLENIDALHDQANNKLPSWLDNTFCKLLYFAKKNGFYKKQAYILLFATFGIACELASPFFLESSVRPYVDEEPNNDNSTYEYLGYYFLVIILNYLFHSCRRYMLSQLIIESDEELTNKAAEKMLSLHFEDSSESLSIIRELRYDVEGYLNNTYNAFFSIITMIAILIELLIKEHSSPDDFWLVGAMAASATVQLILFSFIITRYGQLDKSLKEREEKHEQFKGLISKLSEPNNLLFINLDSQSQWAIDEIKKKLKAAIIPYKKDENKQARLLLTQNIYKACTFGGITMLALQSLKKGIKDSYQFAFIIECVRNYFANLTSILENRKESSSTATELERLFGVMYLSSEEKRWKEKWERLQHEQNHRTREQSNNFVLQNPPQIIFHDIKLNLNISDKDQKILELGQNQELIIPSRKITVIVGKSGIGKSTLIKLFLGYFSKYSGSVFLKQTDGVSIESSDQKSGDKVLLENSQEKSQNLDRVDIRTLTLACLRRQVAFVSQQPGALLPDRNIYDNVYLAKDDQKIYNLVLNDQLQEALKIIKIIEEAIKEVKLDHKLMYIKDIQRKIIEFSDFAEELNDWSTNENRKEGDVLFIKTEIDKNWQAFLMVAQDSTNTHWITAIVPESSNFERVLKEDEEDDYFNNQDHNGYQKLKILLTVQELFKEHNNTISKFSGGELQRISLARAIVKVRYGGVKIIVLDEPTSALNKAMEEHVLNLLKKLRKEATIVMVTHAVEPLRAADSIIFLDVDSVNNKKVIVKAIEPEECSWDDPDNHQDYHSVLMGKSMDYRGLFTTTPDESNNEMLAARIQNIKHNKKPTESTPQSSKRDSIFRESNNYSDHSTNSTFGEPLLRSHRPYSNSESKEVSGTTSRISNVFSFLTSSFRVLYGTSRVNEQLATQIQAEEDVARNNSISFDSSSSRQQR